MLSMLDFSTALAYIERRGSHERTKHYDIEHKWLQLALANKLVTFKYVPSGAQLADILTKFLPVDTYVKL